MAIELTGVIQRRLTRLLGKIQAARADGKLNETIDLLNELFVFERTQPRLEVLKLSSDTELVKEKRALLAELRSSNVYILEKGAIEDYYPDGLTGSGKPGKAQSFIKQLDSAEKVKSTCNEIEVGGVVTPEFEVVFDSLFR